MPPTMYFISPLRIASYLTPGYICEKREARR
jgi:hypothetical protein